VVATLLITFSYYQGCFWAAFALARATARYSATLLPVTSELLVALAADKAIHPLMLESLRMVFALAERLLKTHREAFELRILDSTTGAELPPGQEVALHIGGAQVMSARLAEPGKPQAVVIGKQGLRWLDTGVRGTLNEAGFLMLSPV